MTWRTCWQCNGSGVVQVEPSAGILTTVVCGLCNGARGWHEKLPVLSPSEALRSPIPCIAEVTVGGAPYRFIHDPERPDRLYAEGLLPLPRRF